MRTPFYFGIEVLEDNANLASSWGRCALLVNQASLSKNFKSSIKICHTVLGERLKYLVGPQHGIDGVLQDNMKESTHSVDFLTGLRTYSLYSEIREPSAEMMEEIDTLIFDLPMVGCRVYTFKYTLAACLRAAKRAMKKVVVLDRPNPIGGEVVEGRCLDPNIKSLVGEFPIPLRHGLTMGELALYFNKDIGAELEVVKMKGWNPAMYWQDLQRPWVYTSPNLPTFEAVLFYPGMVLFEGTNVSEGRGTTLPFQLMGAPYIENEYKFTQHVQSLSNSMEGIYLRPAVFQPTFNKGKDQVCRGVHLHVTDPYKIRSVNLALTLLKAFMDFGGDKFCWALPPYEYEYERLPIALLMGSDKIIDYFQRFDLEESFWKYGIKKYTEEIKDFLLYPRKEASFLSTFS